MYRRLASLSAPRGWIQSSRASENRSESQIITAATADFRARGINIKLDARSRSSDVVKVRICFGLALWLASCQRDADPSLPAVQRSRVGTLRGHSRTLFLDMFFKVQLSTEMSSFVL